MYEGRRYGELGHPVVTVNGLPLQTYNHVHDAAPSFEWGYGGSGPSQLAVALIMDATGSKDLAVSMRHDFKREVVQWFADNWALTNEDICARIRKIQLKQ